MQIHGIHRNRSFYELKNERNKDKIKRKNLGKNTWKAKKIRFLCKEYLPTKICKEYLPLNLWLTKWNIVLHIKNALSAFWPTDRLTYFRTRVLLRNSAPKSIKRFYQVKGMNPCEPVTWANAVFFRGGAESLINHIG